MENNILTEKYVVSFKMAFTLKIVDNTNAHLSVIYQSNKNPFVWIEIESIVRTL